MKTQLLKKLYVMRGLVGKPIAVLRCNTAYSYLTNWLNYKQTNWLSAVSNVKRF